MASTKGLRPPARRKRGLTASAARVRVNSPEFQRAGFKQWQRRAWDYYDSIGEIQEAGQFYSRILGKCETFPAYEADDGSLMRITDARVVDVLDRIQDGSGSRQKLQARWGELRFLVGEAFLACTFEEGGECWEVLSRDELRVEPGVGYLRKRGDGWDEETYPEPNGDPQPGDMVAWRLWHPHPRWSGDATCSMRGVLDICEELMILTRAVRAQGRNRLRCAGLLLLPDEITLLGAPPLPVGEDESGDATEDPREDPFVAEFHEAMIRPIEQEGHASSVVPLLARAPGEWLDKVKYISFSDALYPEGAQMNAALARLEMGLDMPVGTLSGAADMNHWSAWIVSREAWQSHGEPVVREFCAELTQAYFRPALELVLPDLLNGPVDLEVKGPSGAVEAVPVDDIERIKVWYDASAVVLNPDRAQDAKDAHKSITISDSALRRELSFDATDAPSIEEWTRRAAITRMPIGVAPSPPVQEGEQPSNVQPGTPGTDPAQTNPPPPESQVEQARIRGLLELATDRAIEAAGGRIRAKLQGNPEAAALYRHVDNRLLAAACGPDVVHNLFGPGCELELVNGAATRLLEPRLGSLTAAASAAVTAAAARHLYSVEPVSFRLGTFSPE